MSALAPFVATVAKGPGRGRPLTQDEARAAMEAMLAGAEAEAVGALLMVLRYRGETAEEIAGFAQGAAVTGWRGVGAALDWPSYAAGRTRGAPVFLAAAVLVARAGVPVLLHGYNSHQAGAASVAAALGPLRIPVVATPGAAARALRDGGIAYAPLAELHPVLLRLIRLRETLGLRSCVNTVARMLNPADAPAAVQGVFHPPYRELQSDAAALLGRRDLTVLKGGGGEFEANPSKPLDVWGLAGGVPLSEVVPAGLPARKLHDPGAPLPQPADLLSGAACDPFAEACLRLTAALALRAARGGPLDAAFTDIDHLRRERSAA